MKKVFYLGLIIGLMLTILTGCSSQQTSQKSEAELRKEIKAELEAEEKAKQGNEENKQENVDATKTPNIDIKDTDALYEYVKTEIADRSRERFNKWEIYYFDITGNGTDEAVLVDPYGADWHDTMEIISVDSGKYARIPVDFSLGKYGNTPDFKDGFLSVTSSSGGPGEHQDSLYLFVYNDSEMVRVLDDILIKHEVAFPDAQFEETGTIDGKLTDFFYTVTKFDKLTNKTALLKKERYTYNESSKKFEVKVLEEAKSTDSSKSDNDDFIKNYTYKVEGGSLKITYNGKTETLIKANGIYEMIKDDGAGPFTMEEKFYVLSANKDGNKLYFKVKAPEYSVGEVSYYIDVLTKKIYWRGQESSQNDAPTNESSSDSPKLNGNLLVIDIPPNGVNKASLNETYHGEYIEHSRYASVVVEDYPPNGNYPFKYFAHFDNPAYSDRPNSYAFAVMGEIYNVRIKSKENMDAAYKEAKMADKVADTIIEVASSFPTDFSVDIILFEDFDGKTYEFTVEDMSDNKSVIAIKLPF